MSHIFSETADGSSKNTLNEALALAVQSALKGYDMENGANITVLVEGVDIFDGEYRIKIKLLILDPELDNDSKYHETDQDLQERLDANQNLSAQMYAASHGYSVFSETDATHGLENQVEALNSYDENANFNAENTTIMIVAPTQFHTNMVAENNSYAPDQSNTYDSPSMGMGIGSSSGGDQAEGKKA